jgi:hypothetical protein
MNTFDDNPFDFDGSDDAMRRSGTELFYSFVPAIPVQLVS